MLERVLTTASVLFVLLVAFGPLERAFPARPEQPVLRREWRLDLAFFLGQYLVWNVLAVATLWIVRDAVQHVQPEVLSAWIAARPLWQRIVVGLLVGDLLVYGFHRACHRFELLWRFHAIHHSAESLDWLAAHREHPVDGLLTQLCQNLPFFALAVRMDAIGALVVFRGAWALLVHANVRLPLGPLRWILGAPELHHWHHARLRDTRHNFANLAPWIDLVFGTHHLPDGDETYPLGNPDPGPRSYLGMMLAPFRRSPPSGNE